MWTKWTKDNAIPHLQTNKNTQTSHAFSLDVHLQCTERGQHNNNIGSFPRAVPPGRLSIAAPAALLPGPPEGSLAILSD